MKVALSDPQHGWITLGLQGEDHELQFDFSHVLDPLPTLIDALLAMHDGTHEASVRFFGEPETLVLDFTVQSGIVTLQVKPSWTSGTGHEAWSTSGDYRQICRPFWRALKAVRGRISEEQWPVLWKRPFPTSQLDRLSAAQILYRAKIYGQAPSH